MGALLNGGPEQLIGSDCHWFLDLGQLRFERWLLVRGNGSTRRQAGIFAAGAQEPSLAGTANWDNREPRLCFGRGSYLSAVAAHAAGQSAYGSYSAGLV